LTAVDAERGHDLLQVLLLQRPGAHGGRSGEGQRVLTAERVALTQHRHQAGLALLDDTIGRNGRATVLQPGMRRAKGRVSGEGQFPTGREDPQSVVGFGGGGRQDEGCLGRIRPPREALHVLIPEVGAVEHHGDRVAKVGPR
jgi:hypothetical protein